MFHCTLEVVLIKHEWISFWIAVILAQWTVSLLRRVTVTVITHSLECYVTVFWSLVSGCRSVCLCSGIEFSLPLLEEKRKSRERSESGQTEDEGWVQDRSPLMGCWSAFSAHQCIHHLWQIKWAQWKRGGGWRWWWWRWIFLAEGDGCPRQDQETRCHLYQTVSFTIMCLCSAFFSYEIWWLCNCLYF